MDDCGEVCGAGCRDRYVPSLGTKSRSQSRASHKYRGWMAWTHLADDRWRAPAAKYLPGVVWRCESRFASCSRSQCLQRAAGNIAAAQSSFWRFSFLISQRRWGLNSGGAPREQAHAAGWDVRATSTQCTAQRQRFLYSYRESEAGRCDHRRQSIGPIGQTLRLHHSRFFVLISVSIPDGILRGKEPFNQCKRAKSIDGWKTRLA